MIHDRENNGDTESFLKENGKKFVGDCLIAMRLMYQGVRLNGETCKQLYNIHDRRLRNCRDARPDIVKSAWVKDANGKRLYVEYWIDVPSRPTKEKLHQAAKVVEMIKKVAEPNLVTVFQLPDEDSKPSFIQKSLFE